MSHFSDVHSTGNTDWPYQAKCSCGWMSIGYRHHKFAKFVGEEHTQFHNAYDHTITSRGGDPA